MDRRSRTRCWYMWSAGCFSELSLELAVVMVGKHVLSNIWKCVQPKLKIFLNKFWSSHPVTTNLPRWEEDFELTELQKTSLFDKQLEMVVQYGFVMLIVAAFSLAPFFALHSNIAEISIDAYKLLISTRWSFTVWSLWIRFIGMYPSGDNISCNCLWCFCNSIY